MWKLCAPFAPCHAPHTPACWALLFLCLQARAALLTAAQCATYDEVKVGTQRQQLRRLFAVLQSPCLLCAACGA